jgi:hypothetical protein
MYHKRCLHLLVSLALLTACAGESTLESEPPTPKPEDPNATPPTPGPVEPLNPYAPGKGDESLTRDEVQIDSGEILTLETYPPQFQLQVRGALPTPCHELRAILLSEPNQQNQIQVQMYSLFDPNTVCTQGTSVEAFAANIPLGSNFPSTSYLVFLNGDEVGEINPVPQPTMTTPQAFAATPVP